MKRKSNAKVSKLSSIENEKLESVFDESFRENLKNNQKIQIDEFECLVEKDLMNGKTKVKVTIYGMAGTTPRKDYHDKKTGKIISGAEKVVVKMNGADVGNFIFEDSFDLNTNDYVVYYIEE